MKTLNISFRNAAIALIAGLWAGVLPFLFFREFFNFPSDHYSLRGAVVLSLSTIFFILIGVGFIDSKNVTVKNFASQVQIFARNVNIPFLVITGTLWLATNLDPWLRTSSFIRILSSVGISAAILLSVYSFYIGRKNPLSIYENTAEHGSYPSRSRLIDLVFWLLLALIIGGAVGLRLHNIMKTAPHIDEFTNINAAIRLIEGVPNEYYRGFWTVTMPETLVFRLFGLNFVYARMIMALINVLAIIPLYFFIKEFSDRWSAIFAAFIYAINPSIVSMAQIARDFAPASILIYVVFLFTVRILRTEGRVWSIEFLRKNRLNILSLALILVFLFTDKYSVMKVVYVNFAVFFGVLIFRAMVEIGDLKKRLILLFVVFIAAAGVWVSIATIYQLGNLASNQLFWNILTTDRYANWSFYFPWINGALVISLLVYVIAEIISQRKNTNFHYLYIMLTLLALLVVTGLTEGSIVHLRSRYFVVIEYYLVPIFAIIFIQANQLVRDRLKFDTVGRLLLGIAVVFLLFINFPAFEKLYKFEYGNHPITNSPHYDFTAAYDYLRTNFKTGDVVVSDQIQRYDNIHDRFLIGAEVLDVSPIYDGKTNITELLTGKDHGWLVISRNKYLKLPGTT